MSQVWVAQRLPRSAEPQAVTTEQSGASLKARVGDRTIELELVQDAEGFGECASQGVLLPFAVAQEGKHVHVWLAGETFVFVIETSAPRRQAAGKGVASGLVAQVPGKITGILVREGDSVEAGQRLVVIESMKMEFVVRAPAPGKVTRVLVQPGAQVVAGTALIEMQAA